MWRRLDMRSLDLQGCYSSHSYYSISVHFSDNLWPHLWINKCKIDMSKLGCMLCCGSRGESALWPSSPIWRESCRRSWFPDISWGTTVITVVIPKSYNTFLVHSLDQDYLRILFSEFQAMWRHLRFIARFTFPQCKLVHTGKGVLAYPFPFSFKHKTGSFPSLKTAFSGSRCTYQTWVLNTSLVSLQERYRALAPSRSIANRNSSASSPSLVWTAVITSFFPGYDVE